MQGHTAYSVTELKVSPAVLTPNPVFSLLVNYDAVLKNSLKCHRLKAVFHFASICCSLKF